MGILSDFFKHPDEVVPMISMYAAAKRAKRYGGSSADLAFCYDLLNRVSRSFAMVTCQLPPALRDAVCVYYLVLRALDTIEDDMSIPEARKVSLLLSFHEDAKACKDGAAVEVCGEGDYRELMVGFAAVSRALAALPAGFAAVLLDTTRDMGAGMAEFVRLGEVKTVKQYDRYCYYVAGLVGVGLSRLFAASGHEQASIADETELATHMALLLQKTNIIRDFLEDMDEEPRPRIWWPREIWEPAAKYDERQGKKLVEIVEQGLGRVELETEEEQQQRRKADGEKTKKKEKKEKGKEKEEKNEGETDASPSQTASPPATDAAASSSSPSPSSSLSPSSVPPLDCPSLDVFARPAPGSAEEAAARRSLNAMVADALRHAVPALEYMSKLHDPAVFRFCAIPQAMAVGTLARCLDNVKVFDGVVKMRRGETAKVFFHLETQANIATIFRVEADEMLRAFLRRPALALDPSAKLLATQLSHIRAVCYNRFDQLGKAKLQRERDERTRQLGPAGRVVPLALALVYLFAANNADLVRFHLGVEENEKSASLDNFNRAAAAVFLGYTVVVAYLGRRP